MWQSMIAYYIEPLRMGVTTRHGRYTWLRSAPFRSALGLGGHSCLPRCDRDAQVPRDDPTFEPDTRIEGQREALGTGSDLEIEEYVLFHPPFEFDLDEIVQNDPADGVTIGSEVARFIGLGMRPLHVDPNDAGR
jgi:hypothetical protein